MSVGGSSGGSTSVSQLDPRLYGDWSQLYQQAQQTAGKAVPAQGVAGFTPTGIAGQQMAVNAAGAGSDALNGAVGTAANLNSFQAPQVQAARASGITSQSNPDSEMLSTSTVTPQSLASTDLSPYLNPYTQDVYGTTLSDLNLARQQAINGNSSDATAMGGEGAWGGSRAGVADSLTNTAFARQAANTAANLNLQGYTNAQGAAQQDIANNLTGQVQNQNTGLAQGLDKYNTQQQTNMANMDAFNSIQEANAQRQQAASSQNASDALGAAQVQSGAAGLLGSLGGQQQSQALAGAQAVGAVGQQQQQLAQQQLDAAYTNAMNQRNLPLQTEESAFGIIPSTASGGTTQNHSTSKGVSS